MTQVLFAAATSPLEVNLDANFTELYTGVAVADAAYAQKWSAVTGKLRLRPYFDASNGALLESVNAAEAAFLPLTVGGSVTRFTVGGGYAGSFDSSGRLLLGGRTSATSGGMVEISGNLVFQPPAGAPTLGSLGDVSFQRLSDTQLKIYMKGSDAVTRSVTLTLA